MWAEMEGTPVLKAAEIARKTYGSFATVWQVKREGTTWAGKEQSRPAGPARIPTSARR
jgi:hypothetical protein